MRSLGTAPRRARSLLVEPLHGDPPVVVLVRARATLPAPAYCATTIAKLSPTESLDSLYVVSEQLVLTLNSCTDIAEGDCEILGRLEAALSST